MAADIESKFDCKVETIEGKGGIFDVHADDKLVFSKQEQGDRFPEHSEVLNSLQALSADS